MNEENEVEDIRTNIITEEIEHSPPDSKEARWIFDYDMLYWQIYAKLKGGWIDEDKKHGTIKVKRRETAKPLLNEEGVETTMSNINAFVNKIQALTSLDVDRIYDMCKDIYEALSLEYYHNMEKFDLDPIKATKVIEMIMNMIEANMRKSLNAVGLRSMAQTERVTEVISDSKDKKRLW